MTLEATLERVSAIRQVLADPAAAVGARGAASGGTEGPAPTATDSGSGSGSGSGESPFASALAQASAGYAEAAGVSDTSYPAGASGLDSTGYQTSAYPLQSLDGVLGSGAVSSLSGGANSPGGRIVAIAESQLGQTEQPPGSNESPAIAEYRSATAGAVPGAPWCAYFASWVARQAGEPIGEAGQGAGGVSDVWSWAQSAGRAIPNGPGVVPKPGDLIVFGDEHVGIVRDVLPNGQIQTIEGNYENKVAANVRSPTEATGYVEMS